MAIPINIETMPTEQVKELFAAITAGNWLSWETGNTAGYVLLWSSEWLRQRTDDDDSIGPVFRGTDDEREFMAEALKLTKTINPETPVQGPLGGWIVKAMLQAIVAAILKELGDGELADKLRDWIDDLLARLK